MAGRQALQRAMAAAPVAMSLSDMALAIHGAAGGSTQNTTGVARLKNGTLVVASQLGADAVQAAAAPYGIGAGDVTISTDAGYHMEVVLYMKYGANLAAVGASQGFCPYCVPFLTAKAITMDGVPRATRCQVWRSLEYAAGKEKSPLTAGYPWLYALDDVEGRRMLFATKAEHDVWFRKRTS